MKCCLDNLSTLLYQVQRKVKLFIELKHFVYFTESDETYEDSLRSMTNSAADTRNCMNRQMPEVFQLLLIFTHVLLIF